jgi:hypothetical protein
MKTGLGLADAPHRIRLSWRWIGNDALSPFKQQRSAEESRW